MTLEERAAEAAARAVCTRCGAPMSQPLPLCGEGRMTTGLYRRVGEKGTEHFSLCSNCGPGLRLYLAGFGVAE